MTDNPYRAPDAIIGDVALPDIGPTPPRPRAVVVTLLFGWILLALFAVTVARFTVDFIWYWREASQVGSFYIRIAWRAGILVVLVVMLMGLHRRTPVGRWLGAIFILAIFSASLVSMIAGNSKSTDYYARIGAGVGTFLVCAPMVYWFYAFTLSRKARTWFNWVPAPDAPR